MITFLSEKAEVEICFVNIENEETFEKCIEVGGHMFEGFMFGEPKII
jgi:c-di-GMP-related signal transduction protein